MQARYQETEAGSQNVAIHWWRDGSVDVHPESRILDAEYDLGKTEFCRSLDGIELSMNNSGYVQTEKRRFNRIVRTRR
jgi:hypothetical protein